MIAVKSSPAMPWTAPEAQLEIETESTKSLALHLRATNVASRATDSGPCWRLTSLVADSIESVRTSAAIFVDMANEGCNLQLGTIAR